MIRVVAFAALLAGSVVLVSGMGDENMLGPGVWSVITIQRCDNHDDYLLDFEMLRYRINRTNDGFKFKLSLDFEITAEFAIRIEICKQADGGCKPYQVMADDSLCEFIKKYAEKNFQDILENAGVESKDCPIPPAEYDLDHMIDYNDLPKEALYGIFGAKVFIIKDKEDIACIFITVEFKKDDDDD